MNTKHQILSYHIIPFYIILFNVRCHDISMSCHCPTHYMIYYNVASRHTGIMYQIHRFHLVCAYLPCTCLFFQSYAEIFNGEPPGQDAATHGGLSSPSTARREPPRPLEGQGAWGSVPATHALPSRLPGAQPPSEDAGRGTGCGRASRTTPGRSGGAW